MSEEKPARTRRDFGSVYARGSTWYARWVERGRERRKAIGPTKAIATRFLAKKRTDLALAEAMGIRAIDAIAFEDFVRMLPAVFAGKKSGRTIVREVEFLRQVAVPYFKGTPLSEIHREDIERFTTRMTHERSLSAGTRNRYLSILSAVFREALIRNHVRENPCRGIVRGKEERREPPYLDLQQQAFLVSHFEGPLKNAILVTLDTGLRLAEMLRLDWRDIDLQGKVLTVRVAKNKKPRRVPFTHRGLEGFLDQRRRRGDHPSTVPDPVFGELNHPDRRGEPGFVPGVRKVWVTGRKKAGFAELRWHDLRHVMATTATRAGVPMADLARILGHGSLAMVSRYAGHTPDNFADLAREKMEAALQAPPRVQEA